MVKTFLHDTRHDIAWSVSTGPLTEWEGPATKRNRPQNLYILEFIEIY